MSDNTSDFTAILIRQNIVTAEQVAEARQLRNTTGVHLETALIKLGYGTAEAVWRAIAEAYGFTFLDLTKVVIPPEVIELVPESVARENVCLPIAASGQSLTVAVADPRDTDLVQKLQFILNRHIHVVVATREQIASAINRHYGESETESVDSMLAEFTDCAIDFTETDSGSEVAALEEVEELLDENADYELTLDADEPASGVNLRDEEADEEDEEECEPARPRTPVVQRHATVRYYDRMNPERMFPLLVILSRKAVLEVAKRRVSQSVSKQFEVKEGSEVEIEPVLPGCACYPPRDTAVVKGEAVRVNFWVVPHVLGTIHDARVVIRQNGQELAAVPLDTCVTRQSATVLVGLLSLVLPFVLVVMRHFRLDFESQLQDGFGFYATVTQWLLTSMSPELLAGLLLAATVGLYFWLKPRQRDVFWDVKLADVKPVPPAPQTPLSVAAPRQAQLLEEAEVRYLAEDYGRALELYEAAFALGKAKARAYHHASLAAVKLGNNARAMSILQEAILRLGEDKVPAVLWFNLGCFAARAQRYDRAMDYLTRAVAGGYARAEKYRDDPDLEPLRWRPDFKKLVASLPETSRKARGG